MGATDDPYDDYGGLIRRFIDGEVSAEDFQKRYLDLFKRESRVLNEQLFQLLDRLFADIDAYCGDPKLREELRKVHPTFHLDEEELRQRAVKAFEELRILMARHKTSD